METEITKDIIRELKIRLIEKENEKKWKISSFNDYSYKRKCDEYEITETTEEKVIIMGCFRITISSNPQHNKENPNTTIIGYVNDINIIYHMCRLEIGWTDRQLGFYRIAITGYDNKEVTKINFANISLKIELI